MCFDVIDAEITCIMRSQVFNLVHEVSTTDEEDVKILYDEDIKIKDRVVSTKEIIFYVSKLTKTHQQ